MTRPTFSSPLGVGYKLCSYPYTCINHLTYTDSAYLRRVVFHTCCRSVILLEISLSWIPLAGHVD